MTASYPLRLPFVVAVMLMVTLVLALVDAMGCKRVPAPPVFLPDGGLDVPESARKDAAALYNLRCLPCHAADGKGSPRTGLTMPDFSSRSFHASRTDEALGRVIVGGGAAIGKSAVMPANPDLGADPTLRQALIEHLRALAAGAKASP